MGNLRQQPAAARAFVRGALAFAYLFGTAAGSTAPAHAATATVNSTGDRTFRLIRSAAASAMMPEVDKVVSDGEWALAVGVFSWDRNSNHSGADPRTALLFHKLPFGWQAVNAADSFSACEFDGWHRAYGISIATAAHLASASGLKYKKAAVECASAAPEHAREIGSPADVIAVRKVLRDGLMVPYVAVSGAYAMAVANGDDVATILLQRMNGTWQRVADFEEGLHVEKLTNEFGVPKRTACAIMPGASADSQCRK